MEKLEIWKKYKKIKKISSNWYGEKYKVKNIKTGKYKIIQTIEKLKYFKLTKSD